MFRLNQTFVTGEGFCKNPLPWSMIENLCSKPWYHCLMWFIPIVTVKGKFAWMMFFKPTNNSNSFRIEFITVRGPLIGLNQAKQFITAKMICIYFLWEIKGIIKFGYSSGRFVAQKTVVISKHMIEQRKDLRITILLEPVSYTHLTLPTNREV